MDHIILRRLRERRRHIPQPLDFPPVDLVHHRIPEIPRIRVHRIRQNIAQHHQLRMPTVHPIFHKKVVEVIQPLVGRPVRLHEIFIDRLEHQAAEHHEPRLLVIRVRLQRERPGLGQPNLQLQRLPVPQHIEFHRVALEFPLHHFRERHRFVTERNRPVTRNVQPVDPHQHISSLQNPRRRTAIVNTRNHHPEIVVR